MQRADVSPYAVARPVGSCPGRADPKLMATSRNGTDDLPAVSRSPGTGGTETVLLVEDEESVRLLVHHLLQRWGYRVLTTAGAREALEVAERCGERIHLLMTDVMMPGMSARELVGRLRALQPEVRVLYVSGYSGQALAKVLEAGAPFLQKPFSAADVARRVREVLDTPPEESRP